MRRRRTRSNAYVVGPFGAGSRGGSELLPYGAQHLEELGYTVTYSDPRASWIVRLKIESVMNAIHRLTPSPVLAAIAEPLRVLRSDLLICIFEDNLGLLAPLVRVRRAFRRNAEARSVLVVCWLAEDLRAMSVRDKRRWGRRLSSFDRVVVFSSNQIPLLEAGLRLPQGLVTFVPFGVSDDIDTRVPAAPHDDGIVLALGGDRARDFNTFIAAAATLTSPTSVLTTDRWRRELGHPPNTTVVGPVSHEEYLQQLDQASIVVIPNQRCAYPTGQTTLLEAMSRGKPCIVTESPALADYVTHGVDVITVRAHDPVAMQAAIKALQDDSELARTISTGARSTAKRFRERAMWSLIVDAVS